MVGQLTLDQHIGVRIPGGQPITFSNFHTFLLRIALRWLRLGCILLRTCFLVEAIDPSDVCARNEMPVEIHGDRDRRMPELVAYIGKARAILNKLGCERVSKIVDAEMPETGTLDGGQEVTSVDVAAIQHATRFRWENQIFRDAPVSFQIRFEKVLVPQSD